jgi:hypothetical protein
MQLSGLAILLLLLSQAVPSVAGQGDWTRSIGGGPVTSYDGTLPHVPLESWLASVSGVSASAIHWEVNDCGEGGDGHEAPTCVEAIIDLDGGRSAHLAIVVKDVKGTDVTPSFWDAAIGSGVSFKGYKSLVEWAAALHARPSRP